MLLAITGHECRTVFGGLALATVSDLGFVAGRAQAEPQRRFEEHGIRVFQSIWGKSVG